MGQPFGWPDLWVKSVAFSPDGRWLATGGASIPDNPIVLWDVTTHKPVIHPLVGHTDDVLSVAFNPDGALLASGSGDRTVRVWNIDPEAWQVRACRVANRNLTREEWQQYLGDEPYRPTCPNLPVLER